MINSKTTIQGIDFYRVDSDMYGNPRYVFHFLQIPLNEKEQDLPILEQHKLRYEKAKKIGIHKYRGKWFGGGLVVQSYNLETDAKLINDL